MTTITDSIYGSSSQYVSSYRALTAGGIYGQTTLSTQSDTGIRLQKLLATLDKIETAAAGFQSAQANAQARSQRLNRLLQALRELNPLNK